MSTPEPLHPLCMAAAQDGTVYAVAFSYWAFEQTSINRDPDFLVALKGSMNAANELEWTPLTVFPRINSNIMADQDYYHSCAVSDDQTQFILHSTVALSFNGFWNPYPRTFSIRVTLSGPYSNSKEYPRTIMTTDLPIAATYRPIPPWAMVSVKDLAAVNVTAVNATAAPSSMYSLFAEWVRFSFISGGEEFMQSFNGSFSQSPTYLVHNGTILPDPNYHVIAMAIQERVLYTLSDGQRITLLGTPLSSFDPSSALPFSSPQTSTFKVALPVNNCYKPSSAMAVKGSSAYIVCVSSTPTFLKVDLITGSVSQIPLSFANKALAEKTWNYKSEVAPNLVAVSDQFLIYTDSFESPRLYYSIDATGYMDNYTLSDVPLFSSNNMNPNWTDTSFTLSNVASVMVSIAALLLAVLLIWAQEKVLRLRKRSWIDDSDIPGSKVAEEMDEEAFRAYQRDEQTRVQRVIEEQISLGQQPDPDPFVTYTDVTVSPQFETSASRPAMTTTTMSRDALSEPHAGMGLYRLRLSSHPRPNVVTTIPDDET